MENRILLAPDSFKECIPAREVCEHLKRGILSTGWEGTVEVVPMADGGEGTLHALNEDCSFEPVHVKVRDPLMRDTKARYFISRDNEWAVVETAEACGLALLRRDERNPHLTTTYGAGELLVDAISKGVKRIIIAIGGSATVDGGTGLARALGYRFLDSEGKDLPHGGLALKELRSIRIPEHRPWEGIQIEIACDVDNPLLGPDGAARMYGPQKGVTPDMVDIEGLEEAMTRLNDVIKKEGGEDLSTRPYGGAAGGMGAGLTFFLRARLRRGFDVVKEWVCLAEKMALAECVVTGEGSTDAQTFRGKVCAGVAETAREIGVPCILISGRIDEARLMQDKLSLCSVHSLERYPGDSESISHARERLYEAGQLLARGQLEGWSPREPGVVFNTPPRPETVADSAQPGAKRARRR